jgi:release factor glutamine methyltransferase
MNAPRDALARGATRLAAAGIDNPRLDARVLLAHAADDPALYDRFLARRIAREPVAYITGTKEFWSLVLDVGPGVLVPRPETETLVEEACREFPDRAARLRAIDFGTGSGAILAAFLCEYPNARGLGIDNSPQALGWAERNLRKHRAGERCELTLADWSAAPGTSFDIVFSNPPYLTGDEIAAAVPELGHEPRAALDGGLDGLAAYRALAPLIAPRLKPEGRAFLEIGLRQGEAVMAILAAAGLETLRIVPDLAGIGRCVVAAQQKTVGKVRASL